MKCSRSRYGIASLVACAQLVLSLVVFGISPTYAQNLDTDPPRLQIDAVDEAARGDLQVFTVTATDDQSVGSVVLFYRLDAESEFQRGEMIRNADDSDRFSFTVPAQSIVPSTSIIQYYIEAKDDAGNRMLQGFSFDPLERSLLDEPSALANADAAADSESTSLLGSFSTAQKVIFGVAGLIVVGALVSAGSGSSGGEASTGPTVPVTITSQPLSAFR